MSLEPYTCELDPETNTILKIYLFKNVQNVEEIRNNIIKGSWSCAAIKPKLILDPFQVVVAANRAAVAEKHNTMVTRTVYGEILYNLSLTKNISQSLSKFGIEKDQNLLVCFLVRDGVDDSDVIVPQIQGEECPLSELSKFTVTEECKNVYKLNKINFKCTEDLIDVIVSRMVTKNFVSH